MTVKQLIEILQRIPDQDTIVMVKGYEQGVDVIQNIIPDIVSVALNVNEEWWNGKHEVISEDHTHTDKQIVRAIVLR